MENGNLLVARGKTHPSLFSSRLLVEPPVWLNDADPAPSACRVQLNYRSPSVKARLTKHPKTGAHVIELEQQVKRVSPGQVAVFYDADDQQCFGSAVVKRH